MKTKLFTLFFVFVAISILYSQENIIPIGKFRDYRDHTSFIEFTTNNRIVKWKSNRDGTHRRLSAISGEYVTTSADGITFLVILWENNRAREKYLLLTSLGGDGRKVFFLYNSNSEPYFIGYRQDDGYYYGDHGLDGDIGMGGINFSPDRINSSSFLVEDGIKYSPEKLGNRIGESWAYRFNGQNGHGILTLNYESLPPDIYMSSGFISYSNPSLYIKNARPKKISLSCGDRSKVIQLADTPHFQYIYVRDIFDFENLITMEILEVYPGTNYSDVCINSFYVMAWQ
ncbi:hypothetical protein AGMMS49579_27070 [Spirochaetia bacterium]|nr:hypothetical protein AGMMS49579_27070 [Spirochaetia bacterium]